MTIATTIPRTATALLAAALLGTCHAAPAAEDAARTQPADAAHVSHIDGDAARAGDPADWSVYNLESAWRDQAGRERRLGSLAGRVQVVALVYTSCPYTCPRIVGEMKRMEAAVAGERPDAVGFVLVSIDPARDTPGQLARFAEGARLDPARWTLLAGADPDVLELAALLGLKYRREGETELSHSNTLTVLDRHGVVVHQQPSLEAGREETLAMVRRLVEGGS